MALSSQLFAIAFCALLSQTYGVEFRWCVKGDAELAKCNQFKAALPKIAQMVGVDITPACVNGMKATNCYEKIKNGEADLITLDGGEIYDAGKDYGMIPIVYEDYGGQTGNSYYAVAVARSNSSINLGNLRDKKSCHTGYRKTAGYNVPVGFLLESKRMERAACGVLGTAKSVSQFFSKSCIPGSPSEYPNLCELCPNKNCVKSKANPYYDYSGAFKCLADGAGDVAFVKHLTVPDMVKQGGHGNLSDYVYLCKDNTIKVVTNDSYQGCSLSNVPSHAVMTMSGRSIDDFKKVLLKASEVCQGSLSMTNCSGFKIFESTGGKDLLFKDSTKQLVDVGNKNTYDKWLGASYMDTLKGLESPCPSSRASVIGPVSTTLFLYLFAGLLLKLFT